MFTEDHPEFIKENSDVNENLNLSIPNEDIITDIKVLKALNNMKNGWAPGSNEISIELWDSVPLSKLWHAMSESDVNIHSVKH